MKTDRWYFQVFQNAPDLIRALLPGGSTPTDLGLDPSKPGDRLYRFSAPELKELSHRLDGVLWPRAATGSMEIGSPEFPVVLLEVQMQSDPGFHHRLAAQTYRFLQQHPRVEHWAVVVITPQRRVRLGPTQFCPRNRRKAPSWDLSPSRCARQQASPYQVGSSSRSGRR